MCSGEVEESGLCMVLSLSATYWLQAIDWKMIRIELTHDVSKFQAKLPSLEMDLSALTFCNSHTIMVDDIIIMIYVINL